MPTLLELPIETDAFKLADWMEVNAILDPDSNTSKVDLLSLISNGADGSEEDQIKTSQSEQLVQAALNELKRREIACAGNYPFIFDSGLLSAKSNFMDNLAYLYCLLISYFGISVDTLSGFSLQQKAKEFEDLCKESITQLLGTDKSPVNVFVFGFPRKASDFDNTQFIKALEQLCKDSGEMRPRNIEAAKVQKRKDAGLDIIAWKKFPDNLPGGVIFWGQCAAGKKWDEKLYDIKNFEHYVDVHADRITGVFIPHTVEADGVAYRQIWEMNTAKAGRIFDRCRITSLVETWDNEHAVDFCEQVLENLRQQQPALVS